MLLSRKDAELVFKLHCALMRFVMEQVQGAGVPAPRAAYPSLPAEQRQQVVKAFLGRLDLIDAFIDANPTRLSEEELAIVSSWRHLVAGRFIALRQLKIADPSRERHRELLDWNGPFNPEAFDSRSATHVMQEGVPDWRKTV